MFGRFFTIIGGVVCVFTILAGGAYIFSKEFSPRVSNPIVSNDGVIAYAPHELTPTPTDMATYGGDNHKEKDVSSSPTQTVIANENSLLAVKNSILLVPHISAHGSSVTVDGDGTLQCRHDDRILQYDRGRKMWHCVKPSRAIFNVVDKTVRVTSDGTIACFNNNEQLYYSTKNHKWHCGRIGQGITVSLADLDNVSTAVPQSSSILSYDGAQWYPMDFSTLANAVAQSVGGSISSTSYWHKPSGNIVAYTSGNVGVGTETPQSLFEVHESATDTVAQIRISDVNDRTLTLTSPRASDNVARIGIDNSSAGLALGTRDHTQALYIDNTNGYIGFNTTMPGYQVDVSGDINIASNSHFKIAGNNLAIDHLNDAQKDIINNNLFLGTSGFTGVFYNNYNTAIGIGALDVQNTDNTQLYYGDNNTAVGYTALTVNTTGYNNSAYGVEALLSNTTGKGNTAYGVRALSSNISGSDNIAQGVDAGHYIADGVTANAVANQSVFLGADTKANASNQTNQIVIGYGATGLGSNTVVIGNNSITKTRLNGDVGIGTSWPGAALDVNGNVRISNQLQFTGTWNQIQGATDAVLNIQSMGAAGHIILSANGVEYMRVTAVGNVGIGTQSPGQKLQVGTNGDGTVAVANAWNTFSDRRFKENIISYDGALDKVLALNPVNFTWKKSGTHDIGFIAQEVKDVIPEVVAQDSNGYYSVNYARLVAPAIAAIQEQNKMITANTRSLDALTTLTGLKQQVKNLTETRDNSNNAQQHDFTDLTEQIAQLFDTTTTLDGRLTTAHNDIAQLTQQLAHIEEQNATILEFFATLNPDTLVLTDSDGNVTLNGILTAQKVKADEVEADSVVVGALSIKGNDDAPTVGTAVIPAGKTSVTVETDVISDGDKIFLTIRDGAVWSAKATDVESGTSFVIRIKDEQEVDTTIDWWIVKTPEGENAHDDSVTPANTNNDGSAEEEERDGAVADDTEDSIDNTSVVEGDGGDSDNSDSDNSDSDDGSEDTDVVIGDAGEMPDESEDGVVDEDTI